MGTNLNKLDPGGVVIWWIRRDLRIHDNAALIAAAASGKAVLPLFVVDPALSRISGEKRLGFMWSGLRSLDTELRARGTQLFVRSGNPVDVLQAVFRQVRASEVFAEEDYTPYARRRDADVARAVSLTLLPGATCVHPKLILNREGKPFRVYSHFRARWEQLATEVSPESLKAPQFTGFMGEFTSDRLPASGEQGQFAAGESFAKHRLDRFVSDSGDLWDYGKTRNRIDLSSTSQLSPYLRFGMISSRTVIGRAFSAVSKADDEQMSSSARSWLNELVWREFYQSALYHFPASATRSLQPASEFVEWSQDESRLRAWRDGMTGYPIVDAAMRQLSAAGWIHNRCRMIVASFLVKDLLIDWKQGSRWFMKHLVDGDVAANTGGWQWTAGTGLDPAPYFRVFNPVLQGQKFDPSGEYVRRWLPELKRVPDRYVHRPWDASIVTSNSSSVFGYPLPVVDHGIARKHFLDAFGNARKKFQNLR